MSDITAEVSPSAHGCGIPPILSPAYTEGCKCFPDTVTAVGSRRLDTDSHANLLST